jgi:hypothetical protein
VETITNLTLFNTAITQNGEPFAKREGISGFPIESVFEKQMDFATVTKVFRGENARGEIIIQNTTAEEKRLRPTTRFQTESGIVFRIQDWVVVPPATTDENGAQVPGKRAVEIVADEQDIYGRFVGELGNLEPTTFFLPGLPESARSSLWATSEQPFTGGYTDWIPVVNQVDIDAAKNKITAELLASAEDDLQKFIAEKNARELSDLALLTGDKFVENEVISLVIPEGILGKELASFPVSAKVKVRTWAYSKEEMYTLLWEELSAKTSPKMKLREIDENSISAQLLERNEKAGLLKIALSVRGAEEYMIDPRSEAGIRFVNDIKSQILGLQLSDAEAILGNREEVSENPKTCREYFRTSVARRESGGGIEK